MVPFAMNSCSSSARALNADLEPSVSAPAGCPSAPAGCPSAPAGCRNAPAGCASASAGCPSAPAGCPSAPAGCASATAGCRNAPAGCASATAGCPSASAGCPQRHCWLPQRPYATVSFGTVRLPHSSPPSSPSTVKLLSSEPPKQPPSACSTFPPKAPSLPRQPCSCCCPLPSPSTPRPARAAVPIERLPQRSRCAQRRGRAYNPPPSNPSTTAQPLPPPRLAPSPALQLPVPFSLRAAPWACQGVAAALAGAHRHGLATTVGTDVEGRVVADAASARLPAPPPLLRYHVPPGPGLQAPLCVRVGSSTMAAPAVRRGGTGGEGGGADNGERGGGGGAHEETVVVVGVRVVVPAREHVLLDGAQN
eukprot:230186-Chlamydomonas_euryale.AAC.1